MRSVTDSISVGPPPSRAFSIARRASHLEEFGSLPRDGRPEDDLPTPCEGLEPGRQVDGLSHAGEVDGGGEADVASQGHPGLDPDAHAEARIPQSFLERERSLHRVLGMGDPGSRHIEEHLHAVAQELVHDPVMLVHHWGS